MNRRALASFAGGLNQAAGHVSNYIMQRKQQLRQEQINKAFSDQFGDKFREAGYDPQMMLALNGGDVAKTLSVASALKGQTHIVGDRVEGRSSIKENAITGNLDAPKTITPGTGEVANSEGEWLSVINNPNASPEKRAMAQKSYDMNKADMDRRWSLQGTAVAAERSLTDEREELELGDTLPGLKAQLAPKSAELAVLKADKVFMENVTKVKASPRWAAQIPAAERARMQRYNALENDVNQLQSQITQKVSRLKALQNTRRAPVQAGKDTSWLESPGGVQYRMMG